MAVKFIPDGYQQIIPYLCVAGAKEAIEFYKNVFNAVQVMGMDDPDGKVAHAELLIGEAKVMICDEFPEMGGVTPLNLGGSPVTIHLYVEDVDSIVAKAVDAGAKLLHPVDDKFYGDRAGGIEDPFGHKWYIATHIEDVSPEEVKKRAEQLFCNEKRKEGAS